MLAAVKAYGSGKGIFGLGGADKHGADAEQSTQQQQRQQQQQRSARSAPEAAKSRAAQMRTQGAPASDRHRAAAFAQRSRGGRERRPLAYERLAYEKAGARGVRVSMPMV
mmetsp:Transcript_7046/g.20627  ORF Transcript_7046/g.20627 Transcript_7046/m.20627 type:complete len:110 (-) Transcript_7046:133-462(-)